MSKPNICCITCEDLDVWVKTKAKPGDVAYWYDHLHKQRYYYFYTKPDPKPAWRLWFEGAAIDKYLEEMNKLKMEEPAVNKRCENCKHFNSVSVKGTAMGSWCEQEKHKGMYVPKFTSCYEYEPKEEKSTPFDGVKFYLINAYTGEIGIKYICDGCGKEMKKPYHWWMKVPYGNAVPEDVGFHFLCEDCDKKKEGS